MVFKHLFGALALAIAATSAHAEDWSTQANERDIVLKDFVFASGEKMDVTMHVTTLGTPHQGADGQIDNAVMVLHGTGGSGHQFFRPQFADELYGPGQPLDIKRFYVILPDNIGHGGSSKPSDGMRMAFPHYGYTDMVGAQKRLLEEGLGVHHLQLILGTSMGAMHAFMWGTTYPGFAQRLAPFACNTVELAGRNRIWRKMAIDAIERDPGWNGGNYTKEPELGLQDAHDILLLAGSSPLAWHKIFSGWLFKNAPSVNVVEHPVYDVWVKSCAMSFPGEEAPAPTSSAKPSGSPSAAPLPKPTPAPSPSPAAPAA